MNPSNMFFHAYSLLTELWKNQCVKNLSNNVEKKMELYMLEVGAFVQHSSFLFSVHNNESGTKNDGGECTYFIKNCIKNEMKD